MYSAGAFKHVQHVPWVHLLDAVVSATAVTG